MASRDRIAGFGTARRLRGGAFSARHQARPAGGMMSLNIAPMVDVVFQLLCFSLVVSQFLKVEGMLPARLPARQEAATADIPRAPIRVRLHADQSGPEQCRVTIDGFQPSPIPIRRLAGALEAIRNAEHGFDARTPVHLLAGNDIAWDHVVNAYNAAIAAQFERVFFGGPS